MGATGTTFSNRKGPLHERARHYSGFRGRTHPLQGRRAAAPPAGDSARRALSGRGAGPAHGSRGGGAGRDAGARRHRRAVGALRRLAGGAGLCQCGDVGRRCAVFAVLPDHRGKRRAQILLRPASHEGCARP
ncbi:hypothetical protein CG51_16665 [Haematobacter missouriensis]|nr:hypothetical protein CG51_16665 [Haematobacter missouriensis]